MSPQSQSTPLQAALTTSVTNGHFLDTVYYLFSSRLSSGRVGKLQPLYANSQVLKAAGQHFRGQLSAGFQMRHELPNDIEDYDYAEDSDLEDDDQDDIATRSDIVFYIYLHQPALDEIDTVNCVDDKQRTLSNFKHVIVIPDVAATTWCALMCYIYTGEIKFALLKSGGKRHENIVKHKRDNPLAPIPCSPKSMYRLAEMIGLEGLKTLALENLQSQLSTVKIMDETFSKFSSWYPEILIAEADHICGLYLPLSSNTTTMTAIEEKISQVARGELPHAEGAIMALLRRFSEHKSITPKELDGDSRPSSPPGGYVPKKKLRSATTTMHAS
ncbi:hypothetical protein EUX98_g7740 [Antrodiella citrinella]|uniref:BTB domain-containing protein n=1 Tax=Antrodiella citrinella TaxID=2447956 RepID=A0A4S4MKU4_9APHY|nr:hypothetical protein EUX98_g7740 [Antrodiella citrinella]